MNRATEIIEYISKDENPNVLILAPNAPPVSRAAGKVNVALSTVFDAQDVNDTLGAFRTRALATSADMSLGMSGSFSFGIKDAGRFRVNFATQRGSRILTITGIPHLIPDPCDLYEDAAIVDSAMGLLASGRAGLILVCGPSAISNAMFSYALLRRVNQNCHKVVYVLERALTFLMQHENSIIIQCELNADVRTMDEGVHGAALFEPDIMYVGDIKPGDDLPGITRAVENGALAILSSVMLNERALLDRFTPSLVSPDQASPFVRSAFRVQQGVGGKLSVFFIENVQGE